MRWSPADLDRLERAIVDGDRVQLWRRGTVYVVIPRAIRMRGGGEALVGTSNTGDEMSFDLEEIEDFDVLM